MKKLGLFAAAIFSAAALAQSNTASAPKNIWQTNTGNVKGARLTILRPTGMMTIKATDQEGNSSKVSEGMDDALGFSIGYSDLELRKVGFIAAGSMIDLKVKDTKWSFMRAEGNLAYLATEVLYMKGGLNFTKITKSPALREVSVNDFASEIGFQLGVGAQFTPMFGAELGYSDMNQSLHKNSSSVFLNEAGPEVQVHATF